MKLVPEQIINEDALAHVVVEIKLHVNRQLREKGHITEETFSKAQDLIVQGS